MRFIKLLINRSSWILGILLFFLATLIYFQLNIIAKTEKISRQMIDMTLSEPTIMAENIAEMLENTANNDGGDLVELLQQNDFLRISVEERMRVIKTPAIKYIYLLYPDGDTFRYLADGSTGEDHARPNQRFESFDRKWVESINSGKALNLYSQEYETIGVTHIRPIVVDGKVQAILVFDLMMKRIEAIDSMSEYLKMVITLTVILLVFIIIIVIFNAFRFYFVRSKLHTDPLTQVNNRNFLDALQHSYNLRDFHVISVDIDHFKKVNDTFGHEGGDVVLHKVAQTISSQLRLRRDFVIRMGGEEFLILIHPDPTALSETLSVVKRIHEAIQNLTIILPSGEEIKVTVSMGVNLKTKHTASFEEALKQSDIALYSAKNNGRNRIEQYEERRFNNHIEAMSLIDVKQAFDEDRLIAFLQPIYRSDDCSISHYEMLARIRGKGGEIIAPNQFLPTIRSTLLEQRLTKRMIECAQRILVHYPHTVLSLNLSVGELSDGDILGILLNDISDEIAHQICLEILETDMADDFVGLGVSVHQLKEKGYRIAIDDFGTGYSNFINIAQLDIDYIKIDGSLIRQIESNVRTATIVEAIQAFSDKLGIMTVAEFVSSDEILRCIQNIGINYVQGYILGKPLAIQEYMPKIKF